MAKQEIEKQKTIKYFSMFTGVGGFEFGIGDKWQCVGFSEIEKYACKFLASKWQNIRNYGDCTKINPNGLPDFDILCGGFPCQAFSLAGKRKGFRDSRGTLFFEIARILKIKRPSIVFLENVKGLLNHDKGETFKIILQTLEKLGYDVQWMVLNSKFFGVPQNRERIFIIGSIRGECRPEILPFKTFNKEINEFKISHTLPSAYYKIARGTTMIQESQGYRVYGTDGTSCTLQGQAGGLGAKTGLYMIKSATKQGFSLANVGDGIRLDYPNSKTARGRVIKGNSNTLKSGTEGVIDNTLKIRRLTPLECERLQGFPDNWTRGFSDTQRYKMMGNAVTVNVIQAITSKLNSWAVILSKTNEFNKEKENGN